MRALVTLCVAVVTIAGHVVNPRGACNADNCLRAIQNPSRTDAASQVCSSVLATSLPPTATASLPSWAGNCGGNISRISSACSCFQGATSSGPTSSPTSSVPSSTTSTSSTTCPAPSTITATLTLPCATTSSTSTCHASTITVPGPTAISTLTLACSSSSASTCAASTVTASATTVTQPASTVTLTSTATRTVEVPQPSNCAQVIANGGFERADRNLFPWLIAGNGGGGLAQDCITCTVYFQLRGIHSPTLVPAVQFVQAFPFCAGNYQLRFKFRSNNSLTWRAQARLILTGSSTLDRSKTIAYPAVGTRTFEVVSFDQFNLPAGGQRGEVWLTITPEGQNTGERVIEVDDIELVQV